MLVWTVLYGGNHADSELDWDEPLVLAHAAGIRGDVGASDISYWLGDQRALMRCQDGGLGCSRSGDTSADATARTVASPVAGDNRQDNTWQNGRS